MLNYTATSIDNSHFNKWMPLIGIYISGATFICVVAIVADLVEGLRTRQYWIPCNWSSLNAASIALITAASKLSLDLSTSMPRQIDQLSKLSTSAFVCIALANAAPSIGKMESGESSANIIALSICVFSSLVGICIQLTNEVVYTFRAAHITMVVTMGVLLVKCLVSTASLSIYRSYSNVRYDTMHQEALKDVKDSKHPTTEKLKQYLERFSMMAYSGCPYFNISRSVASVIYPLCGLVATMAFCTVLIACISHKDKFLGPTSRNGTSSYGWSVLYILISQTIGVGIGTIVLCIRGYSFVAISSKGVDLTTPEKQYTITPQNHWMQGSELTKWLPYLPNIEYKQQKCLGYLLKFPFYMARFVVKIIFIFVDFFLFVFFPMSFWFCIVSVMHVRPHRDEDNPVLEELRPYFLRSFLEFTKIDKMMKSISYVSKRCLGAQERETKHLRELLQKYNSYGFGEVFKFRIPPISPNSQEPPIPHSWSLSVLTLTWIATVLPNIDCNLMNKLRKSVMEGLVYVKLIEDNYNNKHELTHFRYDASLLWLKLDVTDMIRFCFDLHWIPKDHFGDKTTKETLESIKESTKSICTHASHNFPVLVGARYLHGICVMILQDCQNNADDSSVIFDKLCCTISGILAACLINLKSYFILECERCSSIEKRREAACQILKLFGETEQIMKILEERHIPDIPLDKMVYMDSWCKSQQSPPPPPPPPPPGNLV